MKALNHGITSTTTGGGAYGGNNRTVRGSPNARTLVNGVTRFEAEVLGAGYPWRGGEPVNSSYPGGPVRPVNAFVPDGRSFVYVSMGTNDQNAGTPSPVIADNLRWMIGRWTAAGRSPNRFIITTLAPINSTSYGHRFPKLND